jgi:hypothetical protein
MLDTFADKSINHWKRFTKGGVLDIDGLKAEGLNDAQIAILQTEFTERELLSASGDEVQTVDAPSDPIGGSYTLSTGETVQVGKPEAEKPAELKRSKSKE